MAKDLGIKKCWFHKDHYDIPIKRIEEIKSKCILVSDRKITTIRSEERKRRIMSKVEKKITRLKERIEFLEEEVRSALTKKTSNTKEINVGEKQRTINELKAELVKLIQSN